MRLIPSIFLAGMAVLVCGCQATTFQTPPLADGDCDPALVGEWSSLDESGAVNGELRVSVSPNCQFDLSGTSPKPVTAEGPTQAHTARRNGEAFVWFDAGWANRLFDVKDFHAEPGDVYLFRYEVRNKELQLQALDHKLVAHRIIDGDIPGTVHSEDRLLVNRITGPARPEVLDVPGLFSKEVSRFGRAKGGQ